MTVLLIAPIVAQANSEYLRTHDFTAAVEHASFQGVKDTFFVDQGYEIEQCTLAKEEYVFGNVSDAVLSWGSLKATVEMEYAAEHDGPELDGVDWEHAIPGEDPFPAESDPNAPYE